MMINSKFLCFLVGVLPSLFGSILVPAVDAVGTTTPPKTTIHPPPAPELEVQPNGPFRACAQEQTEAGVTVTDSVTKALLPGISVQLTASGALGNLGSTVTDANGFASFLFPAPAAGSYTLTFSARNNDGKLFFALSQLVSKDCSLSLVLETDSSVDACVGKAISITVSVTDTKGLPADNIETTLQFLSGEFINEDFQIYTDTNGVASISLTPRVEFTSSFQFCAFNAVGSPICSVPSELVAVKCNTLPDCSGAKPSKKTLWPPNHELQDITIKGVTDIDGDDFTIEITSIFSDETPATAKGAGGTTKAPDAAGVGTSTAKVRAERSGVAPHNGRVYTISFKAADEKGATCTGAVKVGVPHNKNDTPVDDGPNYDVTKLRTRL